MSLRVDPNWLAGLVEALTQARGQEDRALYQIASGRRNRALSEDPAAAAAVVLDRARQSSVDQFTRNVSSLKSVLEVTDSTLNFAVQVMTRAVAVGVQGANGTLSAANRQALAAEVRGLGQQMLSLANLSFQGNYVFAGTESSRPPFVADSSSASGVRYDGNSAVNQVEVDEGSSVTVNQPGNEVFLNSAGSVFQALRNLEIALESGDGLEAATAPVKQAFDQLNTQRAFYGTTLERLNATEQFLSREKFELTRHESEVAGADLTAASADLLRAQTAREALLAAGARLARQPSLLDLL